jgi:hypothetical protein
VFKLTGWALGPLLAWEYLQAFDIPLDMDNTLLDDQRKHHIHSIIQRTITPLVVLAVFRAMWTDKGGDSGNVGVEQPRLTVHETATGGGVKWSGNKESGEEIYNRVEDKWMASNKEGRYDSVDMNTGLLEDGYKEVTRRETVKKSREDAICQSVRGWSSATRYEFGVQEESEGGNLIPLPPPIQEICANLKYEHDIANAVKADNAVVLVELWDEAVCQRSPTNNKKRALVTIQGYMLRRYHQQLYQDALDFLKSVHGKDWLTKT